MFSRMAFAISLLNSELITLNTFKSCSQNPYSEHWMNIGDMEGRLDKSFKQIKTKMQYLDKYTN